MAIKVVCLHAFGGPENLKLDTVTTVHPGPGEALLRVEAAGINRDHFTFMSGQQFSGHGFIQPQLPSRLGYEATGTVVEVGEGVDHSWIGKHVSPLHGFDESRYGLLGEEAIVPVEFLSEYPSNLTAEEAAAFWVPYLTAYGALVPIAHIGKGDFVSIPAASSAVGLAAIQIVRDAGAFSIALTRTADKKDELLALGSDYVIVLKDEDYKQRINEITNGKGVNVSFDPVGGPFLEKLADASAPGGIIIEYGRLSGLLAPFPLMPVIGKGLTLRGYTLGEVVGNPTSAALARKYILDGLSDSRFIPKIAKIFPLEQIVEAYRYLQSNEQMGRVIIDVK
jgi:NADPH:quinone reductase-like Zn-dependent oxidoreductase